jgi:hypothetical protein
MYVNWRLAALITLMGISAAACQKKEEELTLQQVQQRADSIYRSKIKKLEQQAQEDLDRRRSIELKPKVDSILGKSPATKLNVPTLKVDSAYVGE